MFLLGGAEKHFISGDCIFLPLYAKALKKAGNRKLGINWEGLIWVLDLKISLGNREQIRRNH